MTSYRHTFSKQERLCSHKIIDNLFSLKDIPSAFQYPLSVRWAFRELPGDVPVQVLISVPKRKIKKAHDRNRIRRQLKEIYRLNKNSLYQPLLAQRLQCVVVIVYIAQEKLPYSKLEDALTSIFKKIGEAA